MTLFIDKKKVTKKKKERVEMLSTKKGFDPYKYLGKIQNWEGTKTGMEYQNQVRNEW
jgi:hypothetical protein